MIFIMLFQYVVACKTIQNQQCLKELGEKRYENERESKMFHVAVCFFVFTLYGRCLGRRGIRGKGF